jgi:transcription termination factor Rho
MIDALGGGADAVEPVLQRMGKTRSNAEFLSTLNREV